MLKELNLKVIAMTTKALKGVSDEKWAEFKALAASKDVPMGELFNEAVDVLAKEKPKSQWEKIIGYVETHTSKLTEADIKRMREFRRRFRMRRF